MTSPQYYLKVQRRQKHHLPEEVYAQQNRFVSLTICTAKRGRWLEQPIHAAIVRNELLSLHHDHPVIGYCIMPDHVHLLICNAGSTLGAIMNGFKGRTSRQVRQESPRLNVWQPGYWDHVVRREDGLLATLHYILLNPVRAGLVENWWDHEWSGTPLLGEVGPNIFDHVPAEDVMWRDIPLSHTGGP